MMLWGKRILTLLMLGAFFGFLFHLPLREEVYYLTCRIRYLSLLLGLLLLLAFRVRWRIGGTFLLFLLLILFALPLKMLWQNAGAFHISQAGISTVGGLLPWMDANGYYRDARQLLESGEASAYSSGANRLIFITMFSALLGLTGQNLQWALAWMCLLSAIACYFLIRQVQASYGNLASLASLLILFSYHKFIAGAILSEWVGFLLGTIACTLLLFGLRQDSKFHLFLGLLFLSLAVNSRPGPFFIFPALLLWPLFRGQRFVWNWRFYLGFGSCLAGGFLLNLMLLYGFSHQINSAFSPASTLLYALSSRGANPDTVDLPRDREDWGRPGDHMTSVTSPAITSGPSLTRNQAILRTLAQDPLGILIGIGKAFLKFSYTHFDHVTDLNPYVNLFLFFSFLAAICWALLGSRPSDSLFWGLIGVGIISSVPLIDFVRTRAYASTFPVTAVLFAILIRAIAGRFVTSPIRLVSPAWAPAAAATAFSGTILLAMLLSPILLLGAPHATVAIPAIQCPSGGKALRIRWTAGSFIRLLADTETPLLPNVRMNDFRKGFLGSDSPVFHLQMRTLREGSILSCAYDLISKQTFWMSMDRKMEPAFHQEYDVCGQFRPLPAGSFPILEATEIHAVKNMP